MFPVPFLAEDLQPPKGMTQFYKKKPEEATPDQPAMIVAAQYFLAHISMCSVVYFGDGAIYYMLGISPWFYHFYHRFSLFAFLALLSAIGCLRIRREIALRDVLPISLTQFVASTATCIMQHEGRTSSLYTLRLGDGLVTLLVMHLLPTFTGRRVPKYQTQIMTIIAISSSLAWFDVQVIDTNWYVLLALPVVIISTALHILTTHARQHRLGVSAAEFALCHTGLTSLLLLPMALIFTRVDPEPGTSLFDPAAVWGIVDYVIIVCATPFYVGISYSRYWLVGYCSPENYALIRNAKYSLAAFGQTATLNSMYATVFSGLAKLTSFGSSAFYFAKKLQRESASKRGLLLTANGLADLNSSKKTNGYHGHSNGYHHSNGGTHINGFYNNLSDIPNGHHY